MYETKTQMLSDVTKDIESAKKVDNNTLEIKYSDGTRAIRFHHTDVITWLTNGNIIFDSGGWRTSTTKDRINNYSGYNIHQKDYIWYFENGIKFYDGITFNKNGKLITKNTKLNLKKLKKVKQDIKKYVNLIDDLKELPKPNNGDCWYCLLRGKDGKTMGDLSTDNDHLTQHIKEGYITWLNTG